MTAHDLGWGPPGRTRQQLVRVTVPGMIDSKPYFPLMVRREVAPLFRELCRWLVAERARLGLPPLTCSGGYNKRLIRGSSTAWSNHSWALAGDFCVATNPMRAPLTTDMPPGTSAKAASLGMVWGGDYKRRPDPMHFEVVKTPAEVARLVASLGRRKQSVPVNTAPPTTSESLSEEDDMQYRAIIKVGDDGPIKKGSIALTAPGYFRHVDGERLGAAMAAGLTQAPADEVNAREWDLVRDIALGSD